MLTSQASKMADEKQREKKFTTAENSDLADIICNVTIVREDGTHEEPLLVRLRSKTISNSSVIARVSS